MEILEKYKRNKNKFNSNPNIIFHNPIFRSSLPEVFLGGVPPRGVPRGVPRKRCSENM